LLAWVFFVKKEWDYKGRLRVEMIRLQLASALWSTANLDRQALDVPLIECLVNVHSSVINRGPPACIFSLQGTSQFLLAGGTAPPRTYKLPGFSRLRSGAIGRQPEEYLRARWKGRFQTNVYVGYLVFFGSWLSLFPDTLFRGTSLLVTFDLTVQSKADTGFSSNGRSHPRDGCSEPAKTILTSPTVKNGAYSRFERISVGGRVNHSEGVPFVVLALRILVPAGGTFPGVWGTGFAFVEAGSADLLVRKKRQRGRSVLCATIRRFK